jgi:hypothetical protein
MASSWIEDWLTRQGEKRCHCWIWDASPGSGTSTSSEEVIDQLSVFQRAVAQAFMGG